jgi:hypothetical protein
MKVLRSHSLTQIQFVFCSALFLCFVQFASAFDYQRQARKSNFRDNHWNIKRQTIPAAFSIEENLNKITSHPVETEVNQQIGGEQSLSENDIIDLSESSSFKVGTYNSNKPEIRHINEPAPSIVHDSHQIQHRIEAPVHYVEAPVHYTRPVHLVESPPAEMVTQTVLECEQEPVVVSSSPVLVHTPIIRPTVFGELEHNIKCHEDATWIHDVNFNECNCPAVAAPIQFLEDNEISETRKYTGVFPWWLLPIILLGLLLIGRFLR